MSYTKTELKLISRLLKMRNLSFAGYSGIRECKAVMKLATAGIVEYESFSGNVYQNAYGGDYRQVYAVQGRYWWKK